MLREKDVDDDRKWRSSHSVSKHVFADPPFLVILALGRLSYDPLGDSMVTSRVCCAAGDGAG